MHHFHDFNSFCRSLGRPIIQVDIEDVEYLRGFRFSWSHIATILEVSRSTLYRRLEEEGIATELRYSNITDNDLDRIIMEIKRDHPNDGERMIIGHLTRQNLIIPRARIRASIHRVDPINTQLRRSVTIRRRTYYAEGPNTVWHIDGHHKLIRWKLITHGGIDGYSHTIVYLKCSHNNHAATVLFVFTEAAEVHGLPNRVRTDLGGENYDVWRYMIEQHASEAAVITGSSTHNECIERLWRDVHRCVNILFADTFRAMEEEGILNCLNDVDVFCLHYTFIPRINAALTRFTESWNNHAISTAGNLTPNQLFIRGCIEQGMMPQPPAQFITSGNNTINYQPSDHVEVPVVQFSPCNRLLRDLSVVNPLEVSHEFGVDIYRNVSNIIGSHIVNTCTECV